MVFFLQFIILYFEAEKDTKSKFIEQKLKIFGLKEITLSISFLYLAYAIMLIAAFFGCVSQFRGYWLLIDIHFIPGKNKGEANLQYFNLLQHQLIQKY